MLRLARAQLPLNRPAIMAIVNATPDSFSDGGRFFKPQDAIAHALDLIAQGADIIDIGGESTQPGSKPVSAAEEAQRIVPVVEGLRAQSRVIISIDTYRASTARLALRAGADIINDISAGSDPDMLPLAAQNKAGLVLMHMQGRPDNMQQAPSYQDVVAEVEQYLKARIEACLAAGIALEALLVDPGIGFGKTVQHNLMLLRHLERFSSLGCALLLGISRKRFLAALTGQPFGGLGANLAANLWGVLHGANILRVHEVAELKQACALISALQGLDMNA